MQFLWKWVDELIGKGLELDIILKLILYAAARFVPLALPIAMLIGQIESFPHLKEVHCALSDNLQRISSVNTSIFYTTHFLVKPCILFFLIL